jgi:hypothetical protein
MKCFDILEFDIVTLFFFFELRYNRMANNFQRKVFERSFYPVVILSIISKFRICKANENPSDLFYNWCGPIIAVGLAVSLLALLSLQFLGNYLWMYKFSKCFFGCSCCSTITDAEQTGKQAG